MNACTSPKQTSQMSQPSNTKCSYHETNSGHLLANEPTRPALAQRNLLRSSQRPDSNGTLWKLLLAVHKRSLTALKAPLYARKGVSQAAGQFRLGTDMLRLFQLLVMIDLGLQKLHFGYFVSPRCMRYEIVRW